MKNFSFRSWIQNRETSSKCKIDEVYYADRDEVDGYVDAENLKGQIFWFHTNRTHAKNNKNGMIGVYQATSKGTRKGEAGIYTNEVSLTQPIVFDASEAGVERIQKTGKRTLVAGVSGKVISVNRNTAGMELVVFDPYDKGFFHLIDDPLKRRVVSADEVYFNASEAGDWKLWAKNPKFEDEF